MFKKIIIQTDERGLLFRNGSYTKLLQSGTYRSLPFSEDKIVILNIMKPFGVKDKDLALFLHDEKLLSELDIIVVQDNEYVLQFEEGRFVALLTVGRYAFWNVIKKYTYQRFDIRNPELPQELDRFLLPKLTAYIQAITVQSYESGMLFFNNVLQKELKPGNYYFWKSPIIVTVKTVDLRQQQMDMTGQEIMTEDKVTLRLNFVCQYKIVSPLRSLEIKSFDDQVYIQLQLILREYVGTIKLDELLRMKQEIAAFVLTRLNEKSEDYGIQFLNAGVKDIILPGDIKDILNTVLLAEKKAQANIITRREETASTRSLLNTAKIMDENQTLFRLKELEFLEKICEKIGTISLTGGGNLLEKLNSLLGDRA